MKLEDQVCSLELAKRLKELGVKYESIFSWSNYKDKEIQLTSTAMVKLNFTRPKDMWMYDEAWAAFTVAELAELLNSTWFWDSGKHNNGYTCRVFERAFEKNHHSFDLTEANARSKMLIYLLENKLIELPV